MVNLLANFLLLPGFGLYEDDYLLTLPALSWSWPEYIANVKSVLISWPQGRPVSWALQHTCSYFLGLMNDLTVFHVFSLLLSSIAATFTYYTLRRLVGQFPAIIAAIFFVLFPADSGKQIFMHQAVFPFTTILFLVAVNCCLSRKHTAFFICAALVFFTYEPYFLLLFFVPLLDLQRAPSKAIKFSLIYAGLLILLLLGGLLVRKSIGEPRSADVLANLAVYLPRALLAPAIGGGTALQLCATRAWEAFLHSSAWQYLFVAGTAGVIGLVALRLRNAPQSGAGFAHDYTAPWGLTRLFVAGIGMFLAVYCYRFYPDYYPPIINIGRLSSLHAVGLLGLCVMLSCAVLAIQTYLRPFSSALIWVSSLYLGLLVSAGIEIQTSQYVRNWNQQKQHYSDILALTPDLQDGDLVLVDIESGLAEPGQLDARPTTEGFPPFWMVNYPANLLKLFFVFPTEWKTPPLLLGLWAGADKELTPDGLLVRTPPYVGTDARPALKNHSFILLRWTQGKLQRDSNPIEYQGHLFYPRPPAALDQSQNYPKTRVYNIFFSQGLDRPLWPTVLRSVNYPR